MYLVDSSAWIEYLRATGSAAHVQVTRLIEDGAPVAITEPVIMELLAGARDAGHFRQLEVLTGGLPLMAVDPVCDYPEAAAIYRLARYGGRIVRSLMDCLIAAVAIRRNATLVHYDQDFNVIASCVSLPSLSLL